MTDTKQLIERLLDCAQEAGRISQDPLVAPEDRSGFVIFEQAFADAAKEISELREALKPFVEEFRMERDENPQIDLVEDGSITLGIRINDLRNARAKLEGIKS